MTMELLTIQHLQDGKPTHIITDCEDADTCPSCGAGYKVGLSACEYCRVPVGRHWSVGAAEVPPTDRLAVLQPGEFFIPASVAASLGGYYKRLYDEAEAAA